MPVPSTRCVRRRPPAVSPLRRQLIAELSTVLDGTSRAVLPSMRSTELLCGPTLTIVTSPAERLRHRRAPVPIHFPVEEKVPEGKRHLLLRTALFLVLRKELVGRAATGCDQFVYWNARQPRRCLAPDVFVKLGVEDSLFDSWKSWQQGGVPELAVEILSEFDTPEDRIERKIERYHELGVREVVYFDPDAAPASRIRVWDRISEDLVERVVDTDSTPCVVLGLHWVVAPLPGVDVALRLARDAEGRDLLLTDEERVALLEKQLRAR
jgi:Uma2 family endonuclease